MLDKELLAAFRSAEWRNQKEAQDFVTAVGALAPPDVLKLLEVLVKAAPQDAERQRLRCWAFAQLAEPVAHKGLFRHYLEALKARSVPLRQMLVALLPRVNSIAEHPDLVALLKAPDGELRQVAAAVLKKVGGRTVFEQLGVLVEQPDFAGRLEAVDVLVHTAGHHAIPALKAVLVHGKPPERLQALRLLGDARFVAKDVPGALEAIRVALADPAEGVQAAALSTFASLCSEPEWFDHLQPALDAPALRLVEAAVRSLKHFRSARVVQALDRKLRMGPNAIRFAALETLEALATEDVLPPLVTALSHKQLVVRTRAGEVLTRLSQSGKVDLGRTIVWLLRSRDESVRRMAVELARTVKDPDDQLWPKLLAHLRDEDWWVRERVVDALLEMAGSKLTRHMVGYLADPSDVVRRYAVDVLARLKDVQALGALVRSALQDPDWWVREKAVEAVATLGDARAVPYLVDLLERDVDMRLAVLPALARMRATSALPHIAALAQASDPDVRLAVLEVLALFNDPAQAPAVQPLAQDTDGRVRTAALKLLGGWNIALGLQGGTAGRLEAAMPALDRLLVAVARAEADDLVLAAGRRPMVKRLGQMTPLNEVVFSEELLRGLLLPHLAPQQLSDLASLKEVDFSYEVKLEGLRYRAHIFQQHCGLSAVFRSIKGQLPQIEKLGLPDVVRRFGELHNGLVLVGGPTGSGKSTTLAALIDSINRTHARHIISLEDPIEVVHRRQRSLVTQRELGTHTKSGARALRATLRQDPDVILVGEMRDYATVSFAVSAAETGHLVFGTVHTASADTSVDRLINAFPAGQQEQVRSMLSESLRAVVCQYLLPSTRGGRVLALEVMLNTDAVSTLIRKGKTFQIPSVVATSAEVGMQSMDSHLMRLYRAGDISLADAFMKARDKSEFQALLDAQSEAAPAAPAPAPAPRPVKAPPGVRHTPLPFAPPAPGAARSKVS